MTSNGHIDSSEVNSNCMHDGNEGHQSLHFETKAIHAGQSPLQWKHRAVIPPICLATTYAQDAPAQHAGFEYSRSDNPTRSCLQESIAALEGAKHGLTFSSGLAATSTLTGLLQNGDHVVSFDDVYGGTNRYFRNCASRKGIETSFVDARDPENVRAALRENTRMVWMETPTNPTMKLVDIKAVADIIHATSPSIFLVVDNTFMSPYFQQPLALGADIVMHSVSKYINGHSDVIMGCVATNRHDLHDRIKYLQNAEGAIPGPMDCFLVNRGIKTLAVRMRQHHENGLAVAHYLEAHPSVERVIHPGLPSHPQYELAMRQCTGFSGMVSVYLRGGGPEACAFIKQLRYFTLAESLGSVESLVEIPSLMTHLSVPEDQRKELGITDNLVRISVGIEAKEDLLADLKQALDHVTKMYSKKEASV